MPGDPFGLVGSNSTIPNSARAWNAMVAAAREAHDERASLPGSTDSGLDHYPVFEIEILNQSGTTFEADQLVKVFKPSPTSSSYMNDRWMGKRPTFRAVKADKTTSSFARCLNRIEASAVGKAVLLGGLGKSTINFDGRDRPVASQRFIGGIRQAGMPYLHSIGQRIFTDDGQRNGPQLPIEGIPIGSNQVNYLFPMNYPGMESIEVLAGSAAKTVVFRSRYRQQFMGVFQIAVLVERTRANLVKQATGRHIGYSYPNVVVSARVVSRAGDKLSETITQTVPAVWVSRHPTSFATSGAFDDHFSNVDMPAGAVPPQTLYNKVCLEIPFNTFAEPTHDDPTKWFYTWWIEFSVTSPEFIKKYSTGSFVAKVADAWLQIDEIFRDDTASRFSGGVGTGGAAASSTTEFEPPETIGNSLELDSSAITNSKLTTTTIGSKLKVSEGSFSYTGAAFT